MAGIPIESMNATIAADLMANMIRSCEGADITVSPLEDASR
jgi:hypothetical protein